MKMVELIKPEHVLCLRPGNKTQLLQEFARRAAKTLGLEIQNVLNPLLAREALGSTGIGEGIAIPHARIPGLEHFFAIFARLEKPIDFAAVDREAIDLVVLLLIPMETGNDHLAALACLARRLHDADIARRLRTSADPTVLYGILVAG